MVLWVCGDNGWIAAAWCATGGRRFGSANEGADELVFNLGRDLVDRDSCFGEERSRIFDVIGASGLEIDVRKAGVCEFGALVGLFERSGDAADPKQHALSDGVGNMATNDDVGDGEAAAGAEYAEGFA
jgi:hypothetical protein